MNKKTAYEIVDSFTPRAMAALEAYVDERVSFFKEQLVYASDMEDVREYQGCIKGLLSLKRIRDDAVAVTSVKE